jgi:NADPH:quinone reductase-like Zn-dependent oxidoreductase
MKAVVCERAGGPEALAIRELPIPEARSGWVVIRIKAFGLNRAELFTRQGDSPGVEFPRVLGIECAGEVVDGADTGFVSGQRVVAIMGGMGRQFDGSYAEYTRVPARCVTAIESTLDWPVIGAIPEMFQTAWGSLRAALDVQPGHVLLIRGGTSSIGIASAQIAKRLGVTVASTTRNAARADSLRDLGVDHVVVDSGAIADSVREQFPDGVDAVLELIGTNTLPDSLRCARKRGVVCMTGCLSGHWVWPDFEPFLGLPSTVRLTAYSGARELSRRRRERSGRREDRSRVPPRRDSRRAPVHGSQQGDRQARRRQRVARFGSALLGPSDHHVAVLVAVGIAEPER